ncbi:MAG: hypothetical protein ACRCSR_08880 [Bacteroidales bacterium]
MNFQSAPERFAFRSGAVVIPERIGMHSHAHRLFISCACEMQKIRLKKLSQACEKNNSSFVLNK